MILLPRRCVATPAVWALPRSLATTGGIIVYFLFLQVLRCFSSLRSPPSDSKDSRPSAGWVVPFGNPRIKGHLHLPAAYRSLSRPSSPPRAKASALRPFLLSSRLLLSLIAEKQGSVVYFQLYFSSSYEDRILDIVLYLICLSNMSKIVPLTPAGGVSGE